MKKLIVSLSVGAFLILTASSVNADGFVYDKNTGGFVYEDGAYQQRQRQYEQRENEDRMHRLEKKQKELEDDIRFDREIQREAENKNKWDNLWR